MSTLRKSLVFLSGVVPLLFAVPSVNADWVSEVTKANPLNWWRFEETEATIAFDQGSAGDNGSYVDDVTLGETGLVGKAASFDGAGYVLVEQDNLFFDEGWTFESIFTAEVIGSGSQGVIGGLQGTEGFMSVKAEQWQNTGLLGYTIFGVADVSFDIETPDEFAHVVMLGNDAGVDLYLNGEFIGSGDVPSELSRHVIGAAREDGFGAAGAFLNGMIDELAIYDRELSEDEIKAHFNSISAVTVSGDFDANGVLDAIDIDLLSAEVQSETHNASFDLDGDGAVAQSDRQMWVETLKNTYFGDSNLDGEFSSTDFVTVFAAAKYETGQPAGWAEGDWNGDGLFGSSDFVTAFGAGGYEVGPRVAANAVPEPRISILMFVGSMLLVRFRFQV